jgi:hypothetical protein
MTDVFKESGGKYNGELKKAFAWVADEGVAKPLASGVELMVRNSFLLKKVTGVSKLMPTETSPMAEPTGTPAERFPAGFTPEPPIANAETGLYDGWLIVGDNSASMAGDVSGLYDGMAEMYSAYHYFLMNSRGSDGRQMFKQDKASRKWDIPDGHYRFTPDGIFEPAMEPDPNIPRDMMKLRAFMAANSMDAVVFEHESGSSGVAYLEKIPEKIQKTEEKAEPRKKPGPKPKKQVDS